MEIDENTDTELRSHEHPGTIDCFFGACSPGWNRQDSALETAESLRFSVAQTTWIAWLADVLKGQFFWKQQVT